MQIKTQKMQIMASCWIGNLFLSVTTQTHCIKQHLFKIFLDE